MLPELWPNQPKASLCITSSYISHLPPSVSLTSVTRKYLHIYHRHPFFSSTRHKSFIYYQLSLSLFLLPTSTYIQNNVPLRVLPLDRLRPSLPKAPTASETESLLQQLSPDHRRPRKSDMCCSQACPEVLPRPSGLPTSRHELWNESGHPEVLPNRPQTTRWPDEENDQGTRESNTYVDRHDARKRPWSLARMASQD